jgi:hypothetical protein
MTGFPIRFLGNPSTMEDFSLVLLEDGQELGIARGFWGKLIGKEGFLSKSRGTSK